MTEISTSNGTKAIERVPVRWLMISLCVNLGLIATIIFLIMFFFRNSIPVETGTNTFVPKPIEPENAIVSVLSKLSEPDRQLILQTLAPIPKQFDQQESERSDRLKLKLQELLTTEPFNTTEFETVLEAFTHGSLSDELNRRHQFAVTLAKMSHEGRQKLAVQLSNSDEKIPSALQPLQIPLPAPKQ